MRTAISILAPSRFFFLELLPSFSRLFMNTVLSEKKEALTVLEASYSPPLATQANPTKQP